MSSVSLADTLLSSQFRIEYWTRCLDLVPLADEGSRDWLVESARAANLARDMQQRLKRGLRVQSIGMFAVEEIDVIGRRYAFFVLRRAHDWFRADRYQPDTPEFVRCLDQEICSGVWTLDVVLRRSLEHALVNAKRTPHDVSRMRTAVEVEAENLVASLDIARQLSPLPHDWAYIADESSTIFHGLDRLLNRVGAHNTSSLGCDAGRLR